MQSQYIAPTNTNSMLGVSPSKVPAKKMVELRDRGL
jgi:hypothetical protein